MPQGSAINAPVPQLSNYVFYAAAATTLLVEITDGDGATLNVFTLTVPVGVSALDVLGKAADSTNWPNAAGAVVQNTGNSTIFFNTSRVGGANRFAPSAASLRFLVPNSINKIGAIG